MTQQTKKQQQPQKKKKKNRKRNERKKKATCMFNIVVDFKYRNQLSSNATLLSLFFALCNRYKVERILLLWQLATNRFVFTHYLIPFEPLKFQNSQQQITHTHTHQCAAALCGTPFQLTEHKKRNFIYISGKKKKTKSSVMCIQQFIIFYLFTIEWRTNERFTAKWTKYISVYFDIYRFGGGRSQYKMKSSLTYDVCLMIEL